METQMNFQSIEEGDGQALQSMEMVALLAENLSGNVAIHKTQDAAWIQNEMVTIFAIIVNPL